MTPFEDRNVCSLFSTSCLSIIFRIKLLIFSQLYRVPKPKCLLRFYLNITVKGFKIVFDNNLIMGQNGNARGSSFL